MVNDSKGSEHKLLINIKFPFLFILVSPQQPCIHLIKIKGNKCLPFEDNLFRLQLHWVKINIYISSAHEAILTSSSARDPAMVVHLTIVNIKR